ncbi:DNA-binding transcriptional regulator [soil metagenome]
MHYANLQRRWILFKDWQGVLDVNSDWPKLDGIIFAGATTDVFEFGRSQCKNVVFCSGRGDPSRSPVVALDDEAAGDLAATHLIECRLKRFAFHGQQQGPWSIASNRVRGFRRVLEANGYSCIESPFEAPGAKERASHAHRPALIQWLRDLPKPIGIMTVDDTAANDLAEACLEADIGVPDHVAIIGVNNDELLCESSWPPLSSVEADFTRIGYAAARILERLIAGDVLTSEERKLLLPPLGVVQRQSTNVLAVADRNLSDAVRYIREHACDPCTIGDILRAVPVGRRWLERNFISQLGHSPHEMIAQARIETAKRLLIQKDLSIANIAGRCGYSGDKNFHATFRRIVGSTPAAIRRLVIAGSGA